MTLTKEQIHSTFKIIATQLVGYEILMCSKTIMDKPPPFEDERDLRTDIADLIKGRMSTDIDIDIGEEIDGQLIAMLSVLANEGNSYHIVKECGSLLAEQIETSLRGLALLWQTARHKVLADYARITPADTAQPSSGQSQTAAGKPDNTPEDQ